MRRAKVRRIFFESLTEPMTEPKPAISNSDPAAIRRRLIEIDEMAQTDVPRAIALARSAYAEGLENSNILNLLAFQAEEDGNFDQALAYLDRAAAIDPEDPYVWNAVGLCLQKAGKQGPACNAFAHALKLNPNFVPSHVNLGLALERMGDFSGAVSAFHAALDIDGARADAYGGLAAVAVRQGRWEDVEAFAKLALVRNPSQPAARAALANAALNRHDFIAAETLLTALLSDPALGPEDAPVVHCLLGDALDGQRRWSEAFHQYSLGKSLFRAQNRWRFERPGQETQLALTQRLGSYFAHPTAGDWTKDLALPKSPQETQTGHAFLVGFPRSGTTLLENLFAARSDTSVIDERATLQNIEPPFLLDPLGMDRLRDLTSSAATEQVQLYWEGLTAAKINFVEKYVLDKMPLYSIRLPLIKKIFPSCKIIFSLRDPRDVVLSCFRRPFQMNAGMYQFVTLEGTARFYDAVMSTVEIYRRNLRFDEIIVKYEDLIEAPIPELKRVCDGLGLEWQEDMLDFAAKSQSREIRTPSAQQVRRGLYQTGKDQWRNYADALAPVMPILAPWIEKFGYSLD